MSKSFAVDVGGTFTDVVVLDTASGEVEYAKASTVPSRPADGVHNALAKTDLQLSQAGAFFHGTTLGINTVLERKGAKMGLITTKGFRDSIEIARMWWPMYQLHYVPPAPLVPRYLRFEVTERLDAKGNVVTPLVADDVRAAAQRLVEEGVEAIAVCLIHAYTNPEHERQIGAIIAEEFPDLAVTLSHEVTREYREYERAVTTIVDGSIKRRMTDYLNDLGGSLQQGEFAGGFFVTRCDGGVMTVDEAKERPVRTLISGPASGAMGCVTMGRWLDKSNIIGIDMGGTSFEAVVVVDGQAQVKPSATFADLPLLVPVIELASIGAGGGSLAWIDTGGALNVGPQSAGADPGPIAYGRGGTEPTFTDAALVSGIIDPDNFLGGEMALDLDLAREGIRTKVAEPLGLDVDAAAAGIIALAEAKMGSTLEELTLNRGLDPREFTLLAYGGGGSLLACALARSAAIPTVVVPPSPGTFSAWGMLTLDIVNDFSRTAVSDLETTDVEFIKAQFKELSDEAESAFDRDGIPAERRSVLVSIDMRYLGQEHVLTVPVTAEMLSAFDPDKLREQFDAQHKQTFGYTLPGTTQITAYRARAVGTLDKPKRPQGKATEEGDPLLGTRTADHTGSGGSRDWSIYDRARLQPGSSYAGPAIVQETAATTVVPPGWTFVVDDLNNLIITDSKEQA